MISIESVLEDAHGQPLATPESEEFGFSGARKIEQIGQNACEKLLQGMMKDLHITSRSGVFIIDLNVSVGNMFEAFAALRSSFNLPTFYIGCTDETETAEWFEIHKQVPWIWFSIDFPNQMQKKLNPKREQQGPGKIEIIITSPLLLLNIRTIIIK